MQLVFGVAFDIMATYSTNDIYINTFSFDILRVIRKIHPHRWGRAGYVKQMCIWGGVFKLQCTSTDCTIILTFVTV